MPAGARVLPPLRTGRAPGLLGNVLPAVGMSSVPAPSSHDDAPRAMLASWPQLSSLLAPGIVHQLGNVLFTIAGHAQLLSLQGPEREAILRATNRGSDAIRLMNCLLGEGAPMPAPIDAALQQIADLVRVGLREQGRFLQWVPGPARCELNVDLRTLTQLVLLGLQAYLAALPAVSVGTVTVQRVGTMASDLGVQLDFAPRDGQLPFPIAGAELVAAIHAAGRTLGLRPVARVRGTALELVLPPAQSASPTLARGCSGA